MGAGVGAGAAPEGIGVGRTAALLPIGGTTAGAAVDTGAGAVAIADEATAWAGSGAGGVGGTAATDICSCASDRVRCNRCTHTRARATESARAQGCGELRGNVRVWRPESL